MTFMQIIFFIISAVTLVSAGMVVSAQRLMHAALWLVLALLGVAAAYGMLEASFYVVVQVMVYIGAIAILVIFAVMLTRNLAHDRQVFNRNWWVALLASLGLFVFIILGVSAWDGFHTALPSLSVEATDLARLGEALVTPSAFLIPFEVASVLLLAAIIGAVYIAMDRKGGKQG